MNGRNALPTLATVAVSFVSAGIVPAWSGQPLVPHRAVYDIDLGEASDRSGISSISGRMVYEFGGSHCEGYTVGFRLVTRIETKQLSRLTDQQTSTYENGEGTSFNFVTRSFIDQQLDRELKGYAEIEDSRTTVTLDKPEPATFELPETQFPTRHMQELIEHATGGSQFYETSLFDGSNDADREMTTSILIGERQKTEMNDPEKPVLADLAQESYWPVSISYFDEKDRVGEGLPEYQIQFKLHENGITRDLTIDYGEFSMRGRLVALSLPEQKDHCQG